MSVAANEESGHRRTMKTSPNKWAWVDLKWPLGGGIAEYPTALARDSLAALLSERGQTLEPVSAYDVLSGRVARYPVWLFSAVTCEWPQCRLVAGEVRRRDPEAILVVGGYHVSAMPDDEGMELFDYVVIGEGESVLDEIAGRARQHSGDGSGVRSRTTLLSARHERLDDLPWPTRLRHECAASKLSGLIYPSPSRQRAVAALLLSRGCNSRCSFCASHTIWGSRLITRGVDCVLGEVRHITRDLGVNALVFVDQAFGEDVAWTNELCLRLCEAHIAAKWYCMAKPTLEQSLLSMMARAGCTKIGVGVETADLDMRRALNRPGDSDLDDLNHLFRACNKSGIVVKVYFMIGFPWETPEYLMRTTKRFLENLEANELKITFFTPFPGTDDWSKYSNQLITKAWQYFDTETIPVVFNPNIAVDQYHRIRMDLFRAFYGSRTYVDTTQRLLGIRPQYAQSYLEFAEYLKTYDLISGGEEWLHWLPNPKTTISEVA